MALGFLLLLPLQEFATWRGLSQGLQQDSARRADAERRSGAMLQAIQVATSVDDLQSRMQRLQGPTLTPRRSRPASAPAAGSALRSFTPAAVDAHPVLRRTLIDGGFVVLPIEARPWAGSGPAATPLHRDPFDRLLLAQAEREGLLLITADLVLARYPGPVRHQGSF